MNLESAKRLFGKDPEAAGHKSPAPHPLTEDLSIFLDGVEKAGLNRWWNTLPDRDAIGHLILNMDRERQALIVIAAVERILAIDQRARAFQAKLKDPSNPYQAPGWREIWEPRQELNEFVVAFLRKQLPLSEEQLNTLASWVSYIGSSDRFPAATVMTAAEELAEKCQKSGREFPAEIFAKLNKLLVLLEMIQSDQSTRKLTKRLQIFLNKAPGTPLEGSDVWSREAISAILAQPTERRTAWIELLEQCAQAAGAKPSTKWLKEIRRLIEKEIGAIVFRENVCRWFALVDKPRPADLPSGRTEPMAPLWISDYHADILKGLVWCCELVPDAAVLRTLSALALSSYRKIPGVGPRLTKVGNACIHSLGAIGGLDAIGQLAILRVKVKFGTAQSMLEKALNACAEKAGLPREELEEMSVPSYGLAEVGSSVIPLGEITAKLAIVGTRAVEIEWINSAGKLVKSIPASVKKDYAEDLKELRQAQKDIDRMLAAQCDRLDGLFLQQKSWPFEIWRERYLDHPLIGVLARRLIWKFEDSETKSMGIWNEGRIEDVEGAPIPSSGDTNVSLWHPIESRSDIVQQWRTRIEALGVRQPFKQAHREVYILTPAEENTRVYSNRFACHVLKQHQFNALCGQRGWKNKLRLMVDDSYPPARRTLAIWNLRAEFWIEGIGSDSADTNDSGVYLYVSTDQVRFYTIDTPERTAHAGGGGYQLRREQADNPLPLDQIPPLVFSEIVRDVDLFVGVCSVGNDPTWNDGGPEGRFREYWHDYSFGLLSGTAATRKEILEHLIPRLKIASRCFFLDRYLVVKGSLHDYKIHLGSGNILMSPNDRYLCIVARQSVATGKQDYFLPFEGDHLLSIIISKAFLLAADARITDPSILMQIKG